MKRKLLDRILMWIAYHIDRQWKKDYEAKGGR